MIQRCSDLILSWGRKSLVWAEGFRAACGMRACTKYTLCTQSQSCNDATQGRAATNALGGHTFWHSANSWLLRVQESYCCYQIVHHLHTELRHLIWGHKPQLWAPRKNPKVRWHFGGETETKHGSGLATDCVLCTAAPLASQSSQASFQRALKFPELCWTYHTRLPILRGLDQRSIVS